MCRSIVGIDVSALELEKQVVDEELLISVWINISAGFSEKEASLTVHCCKQSTLNLNYSVGDSVPSRGPDWQESSS